MKKIFLSALFTVAALVSAQAQSMVTPRIELGANFANLDVKDSNNKLKVGYRVGAAAEINLGSGLYLAPGLTYRLAGTKGSEGDKVDMHYLSIPVNIGYRAHFAEDFAISLEAGPYAAYGIAGNNKVFDFYKKGDFGLNGSVALEFQRYYLRLGTEYGLTNIAPKGIADAVKVKNVGFYTTIGIRI